MTRSYWSGQIQTSLVSFGVSLHVATESKSQISFHQISRSTGERVRHQKVLESAIESPSEAANGPVGKEEIVKGDEHRRGEYILFEPSELANLRVPSKHVVEITQFVDLADLSPEHIEKPYFVIAGEQSQAEAFAVVRRGMQKTGKIAIGKIAFSGRACVSAWKASSTCCLSVTR